MAEKAPKYPRLPERQWWALRDRFKQSIPAKVTPSYVSTVLNMKDNSAKANILPALQAVGLIDNEGKPTDRARRWRDDGEYPNVVKEIRESLYPDELLDAIPEPAKHRAAAERWFSNKTGHGEAAARKIAHFYELLADGDPLRAQGKSKRAEKPAAPRRRAAPARPSAPEASLAQPSSAPAESRKHPGTSQMPTLHLDIQIHISPDASADQIEQIFASMAKHLYARP